MNGYTPERTRQIYEQIEDAVAGLPGVTGVAGSMVPLVSGDNWGSNITVEGFTRDPDADTHTNLNAVGPGFFKAIEVPLLAGRDFTRADTLGTPKVAIVNETFAEKFGLGKNPIGRRMASGRSDNLDIEIIGLVKDAKYSEVKSRVPPVYFTPYRQSERTEGLFFYVSTNGSTDSILAAVSPLMATIDPTLPVVDVRTLDQQVRANVFEDRLVSTLASVFAGLATLLAAIGLYGVLAYTVAQRTREIGLRMALGADAGRIRGLVMGQVAWMAAIGGAIGLSLAAIAGYYAESQLYQMKGVDPIVLVSSAGVLTLVAVIAGLIPALRASRVDPMHALRYE
jgi:predicted permease